MLHNLTGWHALIVLAIILVFGAAKLPALAKSLGQSVRILKDETTDKGPSHHEAVTDSISTDQADSKTTGQADTTKDEHETGEHRTGEHRTGDAAREQNPA